MISSCDNLNKSSLGLLAVMPFRVSRGIVAERAKGFLSAIMKLTEKDKARFWKLVNKFGSVQKHTPNLGRCWEWIGSKGGPTKYHQYGSFWANGKLNKASRVSFYITFGKFKEHLFVLHKCDNPGCVRPSHLELGDQKKNMQDCLKRGRINNSKGSKCSWSKLTDKNIVEIRKLSCEGIGQSELGRRFGVSQTNIRDICRRRIWRHIIP